MNASGPEVYIPPSNLNTLEQLSSQQPSPQWTSKQSFNTSQPGLESYPTPTPEQTGHRRILGLRVTTFILSLALVIVILAAAIGGGVGGSIAVQNAKAASASATATVTSTLTATIIVSDGVTATPATSTTSVRFAVPTTGFLVVDCPALTGTTQVVGFDNKAWNFKATCGMDIRGPVDIIAVVSYSFSDCMKACASYNLNSNSEGCQGVTWNSSLDRVRTNFGTCWLKNNTEQTDTTKGKGGNGFVSGLLLSD